MSLIFDIASESTLNGLYTKKLIELYPVSSQFLQSNLFTEKGISLSVLRFDTIHPVISGNKLFKLHYFLEEVTKKNIHHIVTFGGAYSNHLAATAYACELRNLQCTAIVRGEQPASLSHTLQNCLRYGMKLIFISRQQYSQKDEPGFLKNIAGIDGPYSAIPEGGYHPLGAQGAGLMMDYAANNTTHIACAAGTATTVAGLLTKAIAHQQIVAIPVLKTMTDLPERIHYLTGKKFTDQQLHIASKYHFGGYAKSNGLLFDFMNQLYKDYQLPTDFVYTAKMMYGIMDMIRNDFFKMGSNIVCMHTGGLQGNLSLQKGILTFA